MVDWLCDVIGDHSVGLTMVAIATDPADLCVKFVLYHMQVWILEFKWPRQILRKGTLCFTHAIQKLYSLKLNLHISFSLVICFCVKVHLTL